MSSSGIRRPTATVLTRHSAALLVMQILPSDTKRGKLGGSPCDMEEGVSREGSCHSTSVDATLIRRGEHFYSVLVTQARRGSVSFRDFPGIAYQRVK
jgi:hypothetical protein